jgi:hypothetical protein
MRWRSRGARSIGYVENGMRLVAGIRIGLIALLSGIACLPAQAFTVSISAASPRIIYLQVGVGSFSGLYNSGGTPLANPTVNVVSAAVPTGAVGSGTAQPMASNTGATNSFYDNFAFCNAGQLYVGGFYRLTSTAAGAGATLSASSATAMTNGSGGTIPFTQIRWVSSGNGESGVQPFPSGTFTGGTQTIGTIARNQWAESCMTFSYLNTAVPAGGTYAGTVTYTLTAP